MLSCCSVKRNTKIDYDACLDTVNNLFILWQLSVTGYRCSPQLFLALDVYDFCIKDTCLINTDESEFDWFAFL